MILVADSGSTKTNWIFAEKGKEPIAVDSLGINPYYHGKKDIKAEVERSLRSVYDGSLEAVHYYGTGITGEAVAKQIHEIISYCYPDAAEINISSDLIGAARALFGKEPGIATILGTGSNTGFYNGTGISEQVPPLGFWLGDEGSGGYLGKEFFKAYLRQELQKETIELFEKEYGAMTRLHVLENAYQKPFPNRWFASFAEFVIKNKQLADLKQLVDSSLGKLFERYLLKYTSIRSAKIGMVGSIAFYLKQELEVEAKKHNLEVFKIIKNPINELVQFHL